MEVLNEWNQGFGSLCLINGHEWEPEMDIPRSCCVLNLWFPRVCDLRQHSLLSPPPSHLSQVGANIRQRIDSIAVSVFEVILIDLDRIWEEQACLTTASIDGKSLKMLQETKFSDERLGWGDHLTRLAPHHHCQFNNWSIIKLDHSEIRSQHIKKYNFRRRKNCYTTHYSPWPSTHSFHASWFLLAWYGETRLSFAHSMIGSPLRALCLCHGSGVAPSQFRVEKFQTFIHLQIFWIGDIPPTLKKHRIQMFLNYQHPSKHPGSFMQLLSILRFQWKSEPDVGVYSPCMGKHG